jgi:hypothetical protein
LFRQRVHHGGLIAKINLINPHGTGKVADVGALDGWIVKIIEIIDHGNGVASGDERFDKVGADKAGASGDQ